MDTLPPGPQTTSKELDLRTTDFPEAQDWPNRSEDTLNLICVPLIAGEPNPEFRYMPQGVVWECPGFLPYSRPYLDIRQFTLIEDYHWLQTQIKDYRKTFITKYGVNECFGSKAKARLIGGNSAFAGKSDQYFRMTGPRVAWLQRITKKLVFQPENLLTNLGLVHLSGDPDTLIYCNYTNSLQIRELKLGHQNEDYPFRHKLAVPSDLSEIVDFSHNLDDIVYGFDVIPSPRMYAMRYSDSVSVVDESSGSLLNWHMPKQVVDVKTLPLLDCVASLDESGSLQLFNYDEGQTLNVWEHQFAEEMDNFRWARLETSSDPAVMNLTFRKNITTFDTRTGQKAKKIFQIDSTKLNSEIVCSSLVPKSDPNLLFTTTNFSTILLDQRMTNKAVWEIPLIHDESLPIGCDSLVVDQIEYLAQYFTNGDVILAPLDTMNLHQMSLEAQIPSNTSLMSDFLFETEYPCHRLRLPWTGMKILKSGEKDELTLVGLNTVGELYCCDMTLKPEENSPEETNHLWLRPRIPNNSEERWTRSWGQACEDMAFNKRINATFVQAREGLERKIPLESPIPVVLTSRKSRKKEKERNLERKYNNNLKKPPFVKSCRNLNRLKAPKEGWDPQGERVEKIFAGETIFPHITSEDNDAKFRPKTMVLNGEEGPVRARSSIGLPNDSTFVMDQFFRGLQTPSQENSPEPGPDINATIALPTPTETQEPPATQPEAPTSQPEAPASQSDTQQSDEDLFAEFFNVKKETKREITSPPKMGQILSGHLHTPQRIKTKRKRKIIGF